MKIATWNVNSLKVRSGAAGMRLLSARLTLFRNTPDVLSVSY
jgi:exonuclease III